MEIIIQQVKSTYCLCVIAQLSGLWKQFDYYQMSGLCCMTVDAFQQMVNKERVYNFLDGHNMESDQIRVQVLGRVPFLTLREAYVCVP